MDIRNDVPLAPLTTLRVGGRADFFVAVSSQEELEEALLWAQGKKVPVTLLGGGSNVLIADEGVRGLVIQNKISGVSLAEKEDSFFVEVGAGEVFDECIVSLLEKNVCGLENLSGIPGTVGATVIQNVGAYGVEISQYCTAVSVINATNNQVSVLSTEECHFAYRDSVFKREKAFVVMKVAFSFPKKWIPNIAYKDLAFLSTRREVTPQCIREAVLTIRAGKFPDWNVVGTAGSFFKNPVLSAADFKRVLEEYPDIPHFIMQGGAIKISAAWLLDSILHLKGYTKNGVRLFEKQPLVLVTTQSSASTVLTFAQKIQSEVYKKTKIIFEFEVTVLK